MNRIVIVFFLLFYINMYSQNESSKGYYDSYFSEETEKDILKKIDKFYTKLNDFKQEVRRRKRIFDEYDYDKLSRRWNFRKDFIFNNYYATIRGIESSIDVLQTITEQSKKLKWCYNIENMLNDFQNTLDNDASENGSLIKLIDDSINNYVVITNKNLFMIPYDDLMDFLVKKTGVSEEQIKKDSINKGFKSDRSYMEELAKKYIE